MKAWDKTGIGQIMVESVRSDRVENYGIADLSGLTAKLFKSIRLSGLVEKPSSENAPSTLAVIGRYILPSKVIDLLEHTDIGFGGEVQLTDALDELIKLNGLSAFLTDAAIFDCGDKQGFLGANIAVGMRNPKIKKYLLELIEKIDS